MNLPVQPHHVWKNKPVYLKLALPINHGFGNSKELKEGSKGYIVSNGFENGMLRILFDLYSGKETVKLNTESANQYLLSDIALQKF
ncbi:hypothetical protein ABID22_000884 [Pontibacter aydingkolensis]|uniref:Uncharacterized protein n=1 Tax=Pontibacter aydingkolensis TaxID=1911536 RepID=A0ABS7CSQ9_9BACT|nr:hypothetical protein [Pontibacter aydingkolensis]MBW7466864.1 hypothetical protein [Pontibacter aydingkolensis]